MKKVPRTEDKRTIQGNSSHIRDINGLMLHDEKWGKLQEEHSQLKVIINEN